LELQLKKITNIKREKSLVITIFNI